MGLYLPDKEIFLILLMAASEFQRAGFPFHIPAVGLLLNTSGEFSAQRMSPMARHAKAGGGRKGSLLGLRVAPTT